MNIIAVDDERSALWALERAVKSASSLAEINTFLTANEALRFARNHHVDVAFLDIEMGEMSGLLLAKKIKDIHKECNIIFVTGYSSYMGSAFEMHASGYVMKPIDAERVRTELENLRRPVGLHTTHKVRIQCFGNFEVFVDGRPVVFHRPKAKEALAYLVDRNGANVSKRELAAILWENDPYTHSMQSHLYKLITDMKRSLQEAGAEHILILNRGLYAVDTTKVDCDYYSYNKGDALAVNSYRGEYMVNYSWAEFTAGLLDMNL